MGSGFNTETVVSMADGQYVVIGDVYIGDEVISFDKESNAFKPSKVEKMTETEAECVQIVIENGNDLVCSAETKIMMFDRSVKQASEIAVGELLLNERGNAKKVVAVNKLQKSKLINLEVEAKNFIANGIVVVAD